jgi:CHAT domain-containing protein
LVTLSACQTGIGKLQKGEGMLSLARAFNYAGASSIITTLWKINDQSTSEIMASFYKNLSDGLSKKEALRQAKLTYLTTNDDPLLNHPYYWSGIVLTGNTMPVVSTNYLLWIFLSIAGVVLIRFLYVLFLKRHKSK